MATHSDCTLLTIPHGKNSSLLVSDEASSVPAVQCHVVPQDPRCIVTRIPCTWHLHSAHLQIDQK